jgi:7-cyano-7-deazaguanine synthase in queuosine biosynthesis
MGRQVVVWSGGADSTLVLEKLARESTVRQPIMALTVDSHSQVNEHEMDGQRLARAAYLKGASSRKLFIDSWCVSLKTTGQVAAQILPLVTIWFATMMPYIADGDTVHLGYIRGDDFWHIRGEFTAAFEAVCRLNGIKATLQFPLEWHTKTEVVRDLQAYRVPFAHVWTCEAPILVRKKPVQCGTCGKCKAIVRACALPTLHETASMLRIKGKKPAHLQKRAPVKFGWSL